MTRASPNHPQERHLSSRPWVVPLAIVTGVLLMCSLGVVFFVATTPAASGGSTTERASTAVVRAVRDLSRLETAAYHMERVIDRRNKQEALFGLLKTEDAILLVASAEVTAGVDLARLGEDDVSVDPETGAVHITLPEPEVFAARLDNDKTYVHTRKTDTFAERKETLESEARRAAETELKDAALEAGLLPRARANAERTISALIRSLGHEDVTIEWR